MSESFKNYKNKYIRNAAIAAAIIGVSVGLFVCGAVWLALKLSAVNLDFWYYIIIGVGVAAVAAVALFFVIKPSDKAVAKRLDEELKLNEKVQTMVEFGDREGAMLTLQREDADARLSQAPKAKPSVKKIAKLAVLPVLSVAVFLTAVFVPAKQLPPDRSDEYEIDGWQITALSQLIKEVDEESSLREGLKDAHVTILESLLDSLRETTSQSVMKNSVRSAISMISVATDGASSYKVFAEKLAASENQAVAEVADGLTYGAKAYYTGKEISDFAQVKTTEVGLYDAILPIVSDSTSAIEDLVAEYDLTQIKSGVSGLAMSFSDVIISSGYEGDEPMKAAVQVMVDGLNGVAANCSGGYTLSNLKAQVTAVCEDYAEVASEELSVQSYALMMTRYESNKLCAIFGVTVSNPTDPSNPEGNPPDEEEEGSGSGGWGEGGNKYGSDDVIFYPDEGVYVKYGEVLNEYADKMNNLLRECELSEEAKQYIKEYFNILNRGIKDDADADQNT